MRRVSGLVAALTLAACSQSDIPQAQDTSWRYNTDDAPDHYHPVAVYCAQESHDELAPNNPHHWVRVCLSLAELPHHVYKPLYARFNGGLVDIDGFGHVKTYKDDLDTTPSGEFRTFGSPAYERKVAVALSKAKTVTINGLTLDLGPPKWLSVRDPEPIHEYHGADQKQEGHDR